MNNKEYDYWNAVDCIEYRRCACGQVPVWSEHKEGNDYVYALECHYCGSRYSHIEACETIMHWNKLNMTPRDMIHESARLLEELTQYLKS